MSAQIHVAWLTNLTDEFDHAVTDEEFTRVRHDTPGRYQALCGYFVLPCSMLIPPSRPCPRCYTIWVAVSTRLTTPQHSNLDQHRESSLWQRLLGRLRILVATVEPTPQPRKDRTPVPARPADTSITPLSADHHSPGSRR